MSDQYGLGAIPSPADERDYQIGEAYAALGITPAVVIPPEYRIPPEQLQPVMNQTTTPRCVAFSEAGLKGWEDRQDQGRFFDWDTGSFFVAIGGGPNGAITRNGFDQMLKVGYPTTDGDTAALHRIASYYAVGLDQASVQQAVLTLGPVVIGMTWLNSMFNPRSGVLLIDEAQGVGGGHAIQLVGWMLINGVLHWILRNSWGTAWGVSGEAYLPASAFGSLVGEAWKALDVIDPAPVPPTPTPVVLKYGGYAGYRGLWRVAVPGHLRTQPFLTAPIITTMSVGTQIRNEQTTDHGSLYAGSRRWLGDATGNRWFHRSLVTLIK